MAFHQSTNSMKAGVFLCLVLLTCLSLPAQDKTRIKFGKLSRQDFEAAIYPPDSGASAVVLADIGSSEFTGNNKGWFSLEYKFFRRARIISKNGYGIAEIEIPLYAENDFE